MPHPERTGPSPWPEQSGTAASFAVVLISPCIEPRRLRGLHPTDDKQLPTTMWAGQRHSQAWLLWLLGELSAAPAPAVPACPYPGGPEREWQGGCRWEGRRYAVRLVAAKLDPAAAQRARRRRRRTAHQAGHTITAPTPAVAGWRLRPGPRPTCCMGTAPGGQWNSYAKK